MLMIRLQRIGRRNDPAYRIAVLEKERAARAGRVVEALGSYNPKTKVFMVDETRTKEWIAHGAQPTDTLKNLFIAKGVMVGKKADAFPSSARKKARVAAAKLHDEASAAAKKTEEDAKVEAAEAPVAAAEAPAPVEEVPTPVEEVPVEAPADEPLAEAPAAPEEPATAPTKETSA